MDVDISQLQSGDLFMCTGADGVTYKTSGSVVIDLLSSIECSNISELPTLGSSEQPAARSTELLGVCVDIGKVDWLS